MALRDFMTLALMPASGRKPAPVSREGDMNESPEYADQGNPTPASQEPSNAVRGWQSLAEKRGQELAEARARLASYEANDKARQLADEYPDAAELVLREGGSLAPTIENELAAMQRAIAAEREGRGSIIHSNNPRKAPVQAPEPTIKDLEREAGSMLQEYMARRF
jgi:hypothetical protein